MPLLAPAPGHTWASLPKLEPCVLSVSGLGASCVPPEGFGRAITATLPPWLEAC